MYGLRNVQKGMDELGRSIEQSEEVLDQNVAGVDATLFSHIMMSGSKDVF